MNEVQRRETIESLYDLKLRSLATVTELEMIDDRIHKDLEQVKGYPPFRIDWRFDNFDKDRAVKYFDRIMWRYLVNLCNLEKYMLCTEYEKLQSEIEQFKTPEFTPENAQGWLDNLKNMIQENVRLMCKRVYDNLINSTYWVGGWNGEKKKRNNNGVDQRFIITTYDYSRIFGYWNTKPTITDDLEKVCYLLGGEVLPDLTLVTMARNQKAQEVSCKYFAVKFCKNGNTHYILSEDTKKRLNVIGPDGNIIGESIKIKIFD